MGVVDKITRPSRYRPSKHSAHEAHFQLWFDDVSFFSVPLTEVGTWPQIKD